MRIGLVLDHFDPRRGGVEQWSFQLATELLRQNHEVHVIAGGFGSATTALPIIRHELPYRRTRYDRAQAAEDLLRSLPLDVIHDMGFGWYCDVFQPHGGSREASFRQNLLLVPKWMRGYKQFAAAVLPRYREFHALSQKQYARDGRIVLALSQMVRQDIQDDYAFPDDHIRLIYNGVDTVRFSPEHRRNLRQPTREQIGVHDHVLFLIVAHNLRLKGIPYLLQALARLRNKGLPVHLAVVGGKKLKWCQKLTQSLQIDGCVSFLGPQDDPVPFYAAADVYVQPTWYDPCSLVVLEALASGLPVVTTRFNGAGELITNGREGFVIPRPDAVGKLTDAMEACCAPERRTQLSEAARSLALKYRFEENVAEIVSVYAEVTGTASRTVPTARIA